MFPSAVSPGVGNAKPNGSWNLNLRKISFPDQLSKVKFVRTDLGFGQKNIPVVTEDFGPRHFASLADSEKCFAP